MAETDAQPTDPIQKDPSKSLLQFMATFTCSALAAMHAETWTYPLDVLKTRLQITKHLSPFQTTKTLFMNEGVSVLGLGLPAAWARHVFYSGGRLMIYEWLRDSTPLGKNPDGTFPLYKSVICALLGGGIGQFIASPTDFVKVQMQGEGLRVMTGQKRLYRNSFHCTKHLYGKYGFIGLWTGWLPNVQRGAMIQIGDLSAYDKSKRWILSKTSYFHEDDWQLHFLASSITGLLCTIMCNPFDVVKTRRMNNPHEFRGTMHAFSSIVRNEGFFKLYGGFWPIWGRLGPWYVIFYLTFERLRILSGLNSW